MFNPRPLVPGIQPYKPATAIYVPMDMDRPEKQQGLTSLAFMVGVERGRLLGGLLRGPQSKDDTSEDAHRSVTNPMMKAQYENSAKGDVVDMFKWRAFGLPAQSEASKTLLLPPWLIDMLYRGMRQGVSEIVKDESKDLQI
ncbi:MAG: hypothetical protein M1504_03995 [Candidatus Marsarchaeota archaeon]|nr:hypothetical protein [Candidatus Marsarchaeota archaeon]